MSRLELAMPKENLGMLDTSSFGSPPENEDGMELDRPGKDAMSGLPSEPMPFIGAQADEDAAKHVGENRATLEPNTHPEKRKASRGEPSDVHGAERLDGDEGATDYEKD